MKPGTRRRKVDNSRFDEEAAIILSILNDAWGNNWGFVPITDAEVAHTGKKLKPIVFEDLIRIARSEEHTSELQSLMRSSYAVFCLKKKKHNIHNNPHHTQQQK